MGGRSMKDVRGAVLDQCLLEVRRRFWVGSGRPSMLMLVRSAAAFATMRPVLLLRVLASFRFFPPKSADDDDDDDDVCQEWSGFTDAILTFLGNHANRYP